MGSKLKKLRKQIAHAIKDAVSGKKVKKHESLIDKTAKKLAKNMLKKNEPEEKIKIKKAVEVKKKPELWKSDPNIKQPEEADK